MFKWLYRRLGIFNADAPEPVLYDSVYGLPQGAVNDWLAMNPQLAQEHESLRQLAQEHRDKAAVKPENNATPTGGT